VSYRYPLQRSNDRRLPPDFAGDILIWDIDKTYIDTRFSTWRGLFAIPFEFAIDKQSMAGAVPLLHALRHGPDAAPRLTPLYFVSGSPIQLRRVIERKMVIDGVDFDGITFKDQLGLLLKGKARKLREQAGYKLAALLLYRRELPDAARYLLFGDDAERDAEIFSLYAEVCAGLRADPLAKRLRKMGAAKEDAANVCRLAEQLPREESVDQIYVHLVRRTPLESFDRFEGQVVATRDFFEQSLHLAQHGRIRVSDVIRVGRAMIARGVEGEAVARRLDEAAARFALDDALAESVRSGLFEEVAPD